MFWEVDIYEFKRYKDVELLKSLKSTLYFVLTYVIGDLKLYEIIFYCKLLVVFLSLDDISFLKNY